MAHPTPNTRPLERKQRPRRRGNGEGAIYKRKDNGLWCASLTLTTGKRKYLYGHTREDVATKLTRAMRDVQDGLPLPSGRLSVEAFLRRWLEEAARPTLKPSTFESYRGIVEHHLIPGLGRHKLAQLTPLHVQAFLNERSQASAANHHKGRLSPRRVQMLYAVLRVALGRATKWGLVARNVALLVDPPRVPKTNVQALTFTQARALLRAAQGHPYELLYATLLTTGLRVGEALALRWADVDLEAGRLTVRHTLEHLPGQPWRLAEPKSASSRRTIPLLPEALAALSAQRKRVVERRLRAIVWTDHDLVFPGETGEPPHVSSVSHKFKQLLTPAGLPTTHRLHDLRHSMATYLLASGVAHRLVMDLMGHSQISMTMRYQHVLPTMLDAEIRRLAAVFPTLGVAQAAV